MLCKGVGVQMKSKYYPFILIISLCLFAVCLSYREGLISRQIPLETQTAQIEPQTLTATYAKIDQLTTRLEQSIAQLDAILAQYATENERLTTENQAYKDYIDGFWRLMEEEYDFEGHNELYERTH